MNSVRRMLASQAAQRGSILGEYGLWIVLIVMVAAVALTPVGNQIAKIFTDFYCQLGGSGASCQPQATGTDD